MPHLTTRSTLEILEGRRLYSAAPVFDATPHATVDPVSGIGALHGAAHTADGQAITYRWIDRDRPTGAASARLTGRIQATANFTVTAAGDYTFRVTATDADGDIKHATVSLPVNQVATLVRIAQHRQTISAGSTVAMHAELSDQFGHRMLATTPFRWSLDSGPGTIDADTGVYTAPADGAAHLVFRASDAGLTGVTGETLRDV